MGSVQSGLQLLKLPILSARVLQFNLDVTSLLNHRSLNMRKNKPWDRMILDSVVTALPTHSGSCSKNL